MDYILASNGTIYAKQHRTEYRKHVSSASTAQSTNDDTDVFSLSDRNPGLDSCHLYFSY